MPPAVQGRAGSRSAHAEREMLAALFDTMPQLGWTAAADGSVDYCNHPAYEYTGCSCEELEGWGWTSVCHPDDLSKVRESWTRAIAAEEPWALELRLRRRDGVYRWFLARATPVRDEAGILVRWVGIHTEVEDPKLAERPPSETSGSHSDAERELEATVRAREEILAVVSHDLRNPLSTVLMGAKYIEQLAAESDWGESVKKAIGSILRAADRMCRLVDDLLDLAKLHAGQPPSVELETCDVVELIRQAQELHAPQASSRRLLLTVDLPGPTGALCDANRIQQVLGNLIGNAMKFTREGGEIRLRAERIDREVVVSVRDSGTGIPDDQLPHIFEPYWKGDDQRKGGAGLGLAIVKPIVEAHGGRIRVETTVGRGSTFYFTLPLSDPKAAAREEG